jgi:NapH/MauN family ferredoxin-type protein
MAKKRSRGGSGSRKTKAQAAPDLPAPAEIARVMSPPPAPAADASSAPPPTSPSKGKRRVRPPRRGRALQVVRRAVLAVSLLGIFALPLAQLALAIEAGDGAALAAVVGPGLRLASVIPGLPALGGVLSGSVWSITVAGYEISDPLASAIVLVGGRTGVLLAAAAVPAVLTVLLGRVFCGWVCPARLPVELAAWLRRRARRRFKVGLRAPWLRWVKYGVLVAGLGLVALTGWNLLALIYPPAVLTREAQFVLAYGAMGWGAVVLGGAFVADLAVDGGAWCRGLCPGGALYSLLAQGAIVRLSVDEARCTKCERCGKVCPLGLDPVARPGGECDRCGLCQRECRDDALRYRIAAPFARDRERRP